MTHEHHDGFTLFDDDELERLRREQLREGLHKGLSAEAFREQLEKWGEVSGPRPLTAEQAKALFAHAGSAKMRQVLEMLGLGFLDDSEVEAALEKQAEKGREALGDRLVELGYVSESDLLFALAEETGMEVADLDEEIPAEVLAMVPTTFAATYRLVPVAYDRHQRELVVAMADPKNPTVLDDLRFMLDLEVRGAVADPAAVDEALRRYYGVVPTRKVKVRLSDLEAQGFRQGQGLSKVRVREIIRKARRAVAAREQRRPEKQDPRQAEPQPLAAGYLLMAALDGELTAQESADLEDRLAAADPIVRMEWDWLQRVRGATNALRLVEAPADAFNGFVADVEKRLSSAKLEERYETDRLVVRDPAAISPTPPTPPPVPVARHARIAPPQQGGSLEAFGLTQPCAEDGGDFFDLYPSADTLHVAIGDASGKGVASRLAAAAARATLRALARTCDSLVDVMARANELLHHELARAEFASALVLRWDEASERLRWSGAGHERLIVYRAATGRAEALRGGGCALGVVRDAARSFREHELHLDPGDKVLLYTDGLTERQDAMGQHLFADLDPLLRWVESGGTRGAEELARGLLKRCEEHGGGRPLDDDVTVVVLARHPSSGSR